jgi:hypothetical protein
MASADELYQLLGAGTGSLDAYLNLACPVDAAFSLTSSDTSFDASSLPFLPPGLANPPLLHTRHASGSDSATSASSSFDLGCVAPADLSPPPPGAVGNGQQPRSNASSRRPSGEGAGRADESSTGGSPASEKSSNSQKSGGAGGSGIVKKQKKAAKDDQDGALLSSLSFPPWGY